MAEEFSLVDSQTLTRSDIDADGNLYVSSKQNNNSGLNSIRVVMDYEVLDPDGAEDNVSPSFDLTAVVESESAGGQWFPVAYQFDPYYRSDFGPKREIILQPIPTFDVGIDNIVWVGGMTIAQISAQHGKLGSNFRVRIALNEWSADPTTDPGAFTSLKLSVYGERFDT